MPLSSTAKSGFAFLLGGTQFGIFMVLSEVVYSSSGSGGYSVSSNYISDLGANCAGTSSCYIPPSALLFNTSVALLGLFVLAGAYFFHRTYRWAPATAIMSLAGVGALGVGAFPETTGIWHGLFSLMVFLFAGLTAVVSARYQKPPMSFFSVILGLSTLVSLLLYIPGVYLSLGPGGMERMVALPVLLWSIAFGGYLVALGEQPGREGVQTLPAPTNA